MLDVNIQALEAGIEATKIALRDGVLSINIWDKESGLTLTDWNGNPTAAALLNQMTIDLADTLDGANFPQLKDYYVLDLKENKAVVVMDHGDNLMEGWLIDSSKANPGILLSMAIPRAISNADGAKIKSASADDANALNLILTSSKMGLWDMMVDAGDPVSPKNEFTWSQEFRNMLGFENEQDFPNVLESWSNRLHPDHKEETLQAFADHLNDYSGNLGYDIEYLLQLKNGEYQWFRATGETSRDSSGLPVRVVGSIKNVQKEREKTGNTQLLNYNS